MPGRPRHGENIHGTSKEEEKARKTSGKRKDVSVQWDLFRCQEEKDPPKSFMSTGGRGGGRAGPVVSTRMGQQLGRIDTEPRRLERVQLLLSGQVANGCLAHQTPLRKEGKGRIT